MKATRAPKITATIMTGDGPVKIEGRKSETPGLIVTRYTVYDPEINSHGLAPGSPRWVVTHEPSGHMVQPVPFGSVSDALFCCRLLQSVIDWTLTRDEIPLTDPALGRKVGQAFHQAHNRSLGRELVKLRSSL